MSNPFYGTSLLPDDQVEKALKTDAGVERAAALTLSMKEKGMLPHIDKYSKIYNVPRAYVFGIILDEQFRSHSENEISFGDMWDNLLSYFSPSDVSTGMAQTEPVLIGKCFLKYGYEPKSNGGKKIKSILNKEIDDLGVDSGGDTGIDDYLENSLSIIDFDRLDLDATDLSSEFYEKVADQLESDAEFTIEILAFLLSYYRDKWWSIEGLQNLENWHDSIDEWDVIAYTYSRGLEDLIEKGSFGSPEERKSSNLPERPSGASRGKGIGDLGRKALETLDALDGDKDIKEVKRISKRQLKKIIYNLIN